MVSLQVPSIANDFSHLKMLGHVYVVEDAKDLAQIVRDVTRYGGAYRPEVSSALIPNGFFRADCMVGYLRVCPAPVRLEKNREGRG